MEGVCGVVLHLESCLALRVEFPGDTSWPSGLPALTQGWLSHSADDFMDILLQLPSSADFSGCSSAVAAEFLITAGFGDGHCLPGCVLLLGLAQAGGFVLLRAGGCRCTCLLRATLPHAQPAMAAKALL